MRKETKHAGKGADRRYEAVREKGSYLIGGLVLAILLIAAFAVPKLIFTIQDIVRGETMVLSAREKLDISAFGTSYERTLYKRMISYADGIGEGRTYYVAAQDMEDTTELEAFLVSSQTGMHQIGAQFLTDMGFVPNFFAGWTNIEREIEVKKWKQYVIYGDDFAEGVNFILRYVELEWMDGTYRMKLLLDGESGAVYGIRWENTNFSDAGFKDVSIVKREGFNEETMWNLLFLLAVYVGGYDEMLSEDERVILSRLISQNYWDLEKEGHTETEIIYIIAGEMEALGYQWSEEKIQYVEGLMKKANWWIEENGNRLAFAIPYGENTLDLIIKSEHGASEERWHVYNRNIYYRDMILGFPDIYRLIPEFNQG